MNGWSSTDYAIKNQGPVSGIADQPISKIFSITAGGAVKGMVIKVKVSGVTNVGTQTLKLQTGNGGEWVDSKTATFTANGDVYIKLLAAKAADQTYLPLLDAGQVVLTQTDAGDVATIVSCEVLQEL